MDQAVKHILKLDGMLRRLTLLKHVGLSYTDISARLGVTAQSVRLAVRVPSTSTPLQHKITKILQTYVAGIKHDQIWED